MGCNSVNNRFRGFTLSELLISLAILGVIATFTIPKVLQSQQDGKYKAMAKEAMAMVSGAYESYKLNNTVSASTSFEQMLTYMNYLKVETTAPIDEMPNNPYVAVMDCTDTADFYCIKLHSGGVLGMDKGARFGGTATTNSLWLTFDPDGKVSSAKAVDFNLYFNGKLTSSGSCLPDTRVTSDATGSYTLSCPNSSYDPPWFSWD